MFKSIRNIVIILIAFIVIGIIPYVSMLRTSNKARNLSRDTTIVVNNDGQINISEEITFKPNMSKKYFMLIPTILYANEGEVWAHTKNLTVYLNDNLLVNNREYYLKNENRDIIIREIDAIRNTVYQFRINYEYNVTDVVEEYTNLSLLKLSTGKNVSKSNIKIILPQDTNKFELKPYAKIENLGNNTYNIKGKMKAPYSELLIDKGIIKDAKNINKEYETSYIKRTITNENPVILNTIIILLMCTIGILTVTLILTRKPKKERNYVRNLEEVIEPILAESIIDRKIGAKELIMSCIVDLIYRGNLKNIENDKVQLLNYNNISEYEMEILGLFFKEKNQIVTFDEIKEIFLEDNRKTKEFFEKFKVIKKKIEEKLFNDNIYSKLGEYILKILRISSITLILTSIYILFAIIIEEELLVSKLIKCISINIVIAIFVSYIKLNFITRNYVLKLVIILTTISCLSPILFVIFESKKDATIYEHISSVLLITIIFILNIINLGKTSLHVFTQKGKIEFIEAQGLKNYIEDYSLMKERNIESTIIWDDYLAYAVAFGIPNKITTKFNENLMKTNVTIQKIESMLNF